VSVKLTISIRLRSPSKARKRTWKVTAKNSFWKQRRNRKRKPLIRLDQYKSKKTPQAPRKAKKYTKWHLPIESLKQHRRSNSRSKCTMVRSRRLLKHRCHKKNNIPRHSRCLAAGPLWTKPRLKNVRKLCKTNNSSFALNYKINLHHPSGKFSTESWIKTLMCSTCPKGPTKGRLRSGAVLRVAMEKWRTLALETRPMGTFLSSKKNPFLTCCSQRTS